MFLKSPPAAENVMEVNFRPLPPSEAARRAGPGQVPSSDEGQKFMEIIESLTSSENNPDANAEPRPQKEKQKRLQAGENLSDVEKPSPSAPDAPETHSEESDTAHRTVGSNFDVLA